MKDRAIKYVRATSIFFTAVLGLIFTIGFIASHYESLSKLNWIPYSYTNINLFVNLTAIMAAFISVTLLCGLIFIKGQERFSAIAITLILIIIGVLQVSPANYKHNFSRLVGYSTGVAQTTCWFPTSHECNNENSESLWGNEGLSLWGHAQMETLKAERNVPFITPLVTP